MRFLNKQKPFFKPCVLTSPIAMATAHTLAKMQERVAKQK